MLRSIKQLHGRKLGASDGDIGHVKDVYFDDETWAIRYVVVDTASWLFGRSVLIAPNAFGEPHQDGNSLLVKLTREQIENSPPIEAHEPVTRQYEVEYFRHYGWPSYWDGGAMGGSMGLFPMAAPLPHPAPTAERKTNSGNDPHLRSAAAIVGYQIQSSDGTIGHVADFMMDEKTWLICNVLVETGHWFSGKRIVISRDQIERISYDDAKVFVKVTKETIEQSPNYQIPPLGDEYCDTRGFEENC